MNDKYLRDGRAPIPLKDITSKVMSANKAKNTTPEITLRKLLSHEGIRGYRLNWRKAPGSPDIAFPSQKIAIFINGCFWHRCPYCKPRLPKTHRNFWKQKFAKNKNRDKEKVAILRKDGWRVLTIWECQIKKYPNQSVVRVKKVLSAN
ncbi:MAG: very short patch repair endonuclease [Anaerolineales bacterium]|nr:very short patch repair endonuclease [Anaerolineales bacterium]